MIPDDGLPIGRQYLWLGPHSSNRETVKRYFHFEGLGNTIALTDSSGDVQDTYVWTAFGLLLSSSGSSVNPYDET